MMPKREKDPQDPEVAVEPKPERTRRPALPLSDRAAEVIRKTAKYTGLSQEDIKATLATATIQLIGDHGLHSLDDLVEAGCRSIAEGHDKDRAAEREAIFQEKGEG